MRVRIIILSFFIFLPFILYSVENNEYQKAMNYYDNKEYKKAFKIFLNLAKEGNVSSQEFLGYMYEKGYGTDRDYKKAKEWYEKASNNGSIYAKKNLGMLYYFARGVDLDYKKAMDYFLESKDDSVSQYYIGLIYYNGKGVTKDLEESLKWFLKSAEQGDVYSQEYVGYMYDYGYGVDKDHIKAMEWYQKAADQGSAYGLNGLAIIYFNGKGIKQDREKASKLFEEAALNGNLTAQEYMGYIYEFGYGVEKDYKTAIQWYEIAAEKNSSYAYHGLGIMYFDGKGVEKDKKKAFDYFSKASELGKFESMEYLGYMYEFGYGVKLDYNKSVYWYEKANEYNSSYAQFRLGKIYYEGKGVKKDLDKAFEWLNLAASQGHTEAKELLEELLLEGYKRKGTQVKKDLNGPIILPNNKTIPKETAESKVKITGTAFDESGVAIVYINTKEAIIDEDGNFECNVLLKVGDNKIEITAIDIYENESHDSFLIKRTTMKSEEDIEKEESVSLINWYKKQYAVVIGINDYKNTEIPDLKNAENDAKSIYQILKKSNYDVLLLIGKDATKKNILNTIKDLKNKIKMDDSFLFFFAGHGQALETIHGDKKSGYLIPYDAEISLIKGDIIDYDEEAISLEQLKKYLNDIPARHVALLLDSCFSGLVMDSRGLRPTNTRRSSYDYYESLLQNQAINLLTAGDDQPVSDGSEHSPFTRAIIMALEEGSVDIEDGDGFVTFTELAVYVKKKVEKITDRRQRPQYDNLSDEDGDFIFKISR